MDFTIPFLHFPASRLTVIFRSTLKSVSKNSVSQKNVYIVWSSVTRKAKPEFWQNDIFLFTNELT